MYLGSLCVLRPYRALLGHSRYLRPIVKLGKDKFQISIDVRQFNKDEISVKARKEFVVITGKQERKLQDGFVIRQFVRKYKLPPGCNAYRVFSTLKDNGTLTVTAPRDVPDDINLPTEIPVPIKVCGSDSKTDPQCIEIEVPTKSIKSLCDYYMKKNKPGGQDGGNPPPMCPPSTSPTQTCTPSTSPPPTYTPSTSPPPTYTPPTSPPPTYPSPPPKT